MQLDRRQVLAALGASFLVPAQGWAGAGGQGARVSIGGMQVQTLSDGHLRLPRSVLFEGLNPDAVDQILKAHGVADGPIEPPINVTLLRDQGRVVLFDAGSGPGFQDTAGRLADTLEAEGVSVDDVTHVVFTHCHPDHLWGIVDDFDELLFPNAEYMMGQVEWDYWFAADLATRMPSERAAMAVGARRRMAQIEDRVTRFKDGEEILPGVAAHATFGHTPGHMSFELRDAGESILIVGDAIGNNSISFERPDWPIGTDQDAEAAAQTRIRLLDMLAKDNMRLIGYHFINGGLGIVERSQNSYRFVSN